MSIVRTSFALSLALVLGGAACGGSKKESTVPADNTAGEKSLYERLGGKEAIEAVVGEFLANVVADDRINARFKDTDAARLKQLLVDQVCAATGGPCTYSGKTMPEAHAGMGITEDEFTALVEDLVKALDKFQVGEKEKSDLLTALGGMKGDIVGK